MTMFEPPTPGTVSPSVAAHRIIRFLEDAQIDADIDLDGITSWSQLTTRNFDTDALITDAIGAADLDRADALFVDNVDRIVTSWLQDRDAEVNP